MAPQTPLLLVDNVFDTVNLYPGATIDAISEVAGREAFRVADYRRDRTWWQPSSDGGGSDPWVRVHLTAAHGVDAIWLDRRHNLASKSVFLEGSTDGVTWSVSQQLNIPATGVVGGTPVAPAMCATEEGACWTLMSSALASRAWWRLRTPYSAGFVPAVPGIIAGLKTQMINFSKTFDEDASSRTEVAQESTAGYRAVDTTYAWRTTALTLGMIGATEYDATMRTLKTLLFDKNQPWVQMMDYGTYPERAWMYQWYGTNWAMAKTRVYRDGVITGREVGQRLG